MSAFPSTERRSKPGLRSPTQPTARTSDSRTVLSCVRTIRSYGCTAQRNEYGSGRGSSCLCTETSSSARSRAGRLSRSPTRAPSPSSFVSISEWTQPSARRPGETRDAREPFSPYCAPVLVLGERASAEPGPVSGEAEGERFELSIRLTTDNGFRDRRIRPLCHPSAGGRRTAAGAALAEKEGFEPSMEPFSPITP